MTVAELPVLAPSIDAVAFICPECGDEPTEVGVRHDGYGLPQACCSCADCDQQWNVALGGAQALALGLDPVGPTELERGLHGRAFALFADLD